MRILYLSQYFPPEAGATQTRAFEMARAWVRLGHQVTMLCEFPNHPSGIIPPDYHHQFIQRDSLEGIDVLRVWVKASPEKTFRNRMLFYLTFMANATLAGLFYARDRYDLVYASSPPLFTGAAGLALSYSRRLPLVFEVRDLWPESAVALGELRNPGFIRLAEKLELACYRRAGKIVVVTAGIQQRLQDRTNLADKIILVPNGANIDDFSYDPQRRQEWRDRLGWQDRFIAIYAGIFGIAQGLETILQAAERLREHAHIAFLLVGAGPQRQQIERLAAELALPNLCILPEQPREAMPGLLSAADLALAPLRNIDLFKGAVPSKIFDAWACQRPVVLSIDGEARQVVQRAGGGQFVPPEDPSALAQAVLFLSQHPEICQQMGTAGRNFTAQFYSRPALAEELIRVLESIH
jgi:glycosyltransferase involved in cell wall biosynthesis